MSQSLLNAPTLSIIAPTYNERGNIRPLAKAVADCMGHTPWELIFVDDDSPDGTRHEIAALVQEGAPVRCLRRVGRRGLASAVVEGAMSANGEIIAVIDADMQHDETLLPRMLRRLQTTDSDVVIASRHVEEGSLGDLHAHRRLVSALATLFAKLLIGESLRDPMSGFFMTRRSVFDATIYDLSQQGYKILLDILTSSQRPLKVVEVPYVFRDRRSGQSKLDAMVIAEYAFLLIEKLSYGLVPARFVLFSFVGGLGLFVHLAILTQLKMLGDRVPASSDYFNYPCHDIQLCRQQLSHLQGRASERLAVPYWLRGFRCNLQPRRNRQHKRRKPNIKPRHQLAARRCSRRNHERCL